MAPSLHIAKSDMMIRKPVQEVFDAFINPEVTTKFWFTHSTGKLEEDKQLTWTWSMYNLDVPVYVKKIDPNKSILIEWGAGKDKCTAQWIFKSLGLDNTFVTITSYDFQGSKEELVQQVIDSTGGFTLVLAGLKAWLEHHIQLKLIEDKFPNELLK